MLTSARKELITLDYYKTGLFYDTSAILNYVEV